MGKEELVNELLIYLISENKELGKVDVPKDYSNKRKLLRAVMNVREPKAISPEILKLQDELLSKENKDKNIISPYDLLTVGEVFKETKIPFEDKIILWQGDITTINADAIVNAANSKMLGCFAPLHRCIDNAIHSAAGIQLRLECRELMEKQGKDEPTGRAKITGAYNLPSKYVLHTVGPIIYDALTEEDCGLLASCYSSCLEEAKKHEDIKTVAFCCISTGEFRFPKDEAAKIAVETVSRWLENNRDVLDRIIFNVFTVEDYDEYSKLFGEYKSSF
ncbi:protein-ADP-ribose hydrolase [Clostridium sp. 19966]|uniref:protein-ADP-ribose hydrolase n=1 Tax=Clostridium sp. 19966 TaxID=2768166 RepID=UPI0028DF6170|nr:protein-ADP-ribose hydrolase [Clostridium sp. 19966]MDT8719315.1 protein-ADP-ribose hydrolase [Clostridium sp. 19966]